MRHFAGGGRLKLVSAYARVYQHSNVAGGKSGSFEGLVRRLCRAIGHRLTRIPPAPLTDAGERIKLTGLEVERLIDRRQSIFEHVGRDDIRREFVTKCSDMNAGV